MRVLACVLAAAVLLVPSAAATPRGLKLLVRDGTSLALVYVDRVVPFTQPLRPAAGAPAFSGDGRLISIGGTILGRAKLPTTTLVWAPTGERAAYVTTDGAVVVWTPAGKRRVEPGGWGAQRVLPALAWSRDGRLAITRDRSIWVWRAGRARRLLGPLPGDDIPVPAAWHGGHVLWWEWPGSGSVAADGVALYEDTTRLGTMLMYRDYLAVCGQHVAFAAGGDRYAMDNKTIVFDGGDVSRDPRRSWVSPTCTADGRLVAAASRSLIPARLGHEHRSIWQLLPTRRRLTSPPWGWTDEDPQLAADGSVLFVRTRASAARAGGTWRDTVVGRVMLLAHAKLHQVAQIGASTLEDSSTWFLPQYYGHYDFGPLLAVSAS